MANTELMLCDYEGCNKPFAYRVSGFNLCAEHCEFGKGIMTIVESKLIAELKAKLAALEWTPITAGNLPKGPSGDYAGDEVLTLRKKDGAVIQIHAASCKWSCLDHDEDSPYADFMRPINPPQEPK